jgi:serine phosphatase RsbU (regulator of sigma subunit)
MDEFGPSYSPDDKKIAYTRYDGLDPQSATLSYANAGHDLPYLWHGGDAEELRARGMPLGLMPGMSYEEGEISWRG